MKLARHKKHHCSCPAVHKIPAPRQMNSMHRCHCQLMKKSSELPMDYDDWKRIWADSERTLSAVLDTRPSPSHSRSVSHPVSSFILAHLSICHMALPLLASGLPQFCELVEPTWTSLNLSWNNACACEQLGNHFKFVGTDLWTIEPIGTLGTR